MGGKMKAFNILPETFILPHEYVQFVDSFTKRTNELGANRNLWIMKVGYIVLVSYDGI